MKNRIFIVCLLAAVLSACSQIPQKELTFTACTPMPADGRACACACTLDGKAYIFGGRNAKGYYQADLWQYDPATDAWTKISRIPSGVGRVHPAMAAYNGSLYLGLGFAQGGATEDSCHLRDWWRYTPATDTWEQLAEYPNKFTIDAHAFALGDEIYTIYGGNGGFSRYIIHYSVADNTWAEYADNWHRARPNFGGRGAWLDGMYYFGTGYNTANLRTWWATDITSDQWEERTPIPGKGRQFSACAAGKDHIYLLGGRCFAGDQTGGEVFDSYMRYRPATNSWEWCGTMPCGRAENQIAFSIDGKVYFGLGENENGQLHNTLYRIEE